MKAAKEASRKARQEEHNASRKLLRAAERDSQHAAAIRLIDAALVVAERPGQTVPQLSAALDTLAASINDGDTDTALGLIRLVGVEHLLRAACPGPTTPLGVHARLADQVRFDLISDYFCNPDIGWIVEQRSDNSAHGT